MSRLDVIAPRARKHGGRDSVEFDAPPLPDAQGRVSVMLTPPREIGGPGTARQVDSELGAFNGNQSAF